MIGTTMFFSEPGDAALYDPDISTDQFDLIGTSRIKLVGNLVKVTPLPQREGSAPEASSGKSLGTITSTNSKTNADRRKQAAFLEQLMNVKKNKGEHDNVSVLMNTKISKLAASGKLRLNTQRRGEEIDTLNQRVVRGDAEALQKLEAIYSGRDAEDSDDEVQPIEDQGAHRERSETPVTAYPQPS